MKTNPPIQGPDEGTFTQRYYVYNTLIDTVIFYLGNYVIDKAVNVGTPKLHHAAIFLATNVAVRNNILDIKALLEKRDAAEGNEAFVRETLILGGYILTSTLWDSLISDKSFANSLIGNVVRGFVGLGGNLLVDLGIDYRYK